MGCTAHLNSNEQDADYAVIEIGMNHPGEIAPLSILTNPDVALIISVAPAHLAAFKSIEGIAQEKASVAKGLKGDGSIIINCDIPTLETVKFEINSHNLVLFAMDQKIKEIGY